MKKVSLLFAVATLMFFVSCDNQDNTINQDGAVTQQLTDDQKAVNTLLVLNEGLKKVDFSKLSLVAKSRTGESLALDTSIPLGEIYNQDGLKINADLVLGLTDGIGIKLVLDMDNFAIQTTDNSSASVSGTLELSLAYRTDLLTQKIVVSANTPDDDVLVFTGGVMDGQNIGLKNLEMSYNFSELNLGSPVAVKGTVAVNGVDMYVDSKILEMLTSVM